MRNLFIVFFCLVSVLTIKANGQESLWKIQATDYQGTYYGAAVANGGIGILPWKEPFSIRHVMLNHVFDAAGPQDVSRVLRGINPFNLQMQINGQMVNGDNVSEWKQCIDMREAMHNTCFTYGGKANIAYSICALRNLPYAGLIRVEVKALEDMYLSVANAIDVPDEYKNPESKQISVNVDGNELKIVRTWALSKYREQEVSASSAFIYDKNPSVQQQYNGANRISVSIKKGEKFAFSLLGAVCTGRDFIDPYNESDREVIYGAKEGLNRLMNGHRKLWNELWEGDIMIEGDDEAQRAVRFALYNLYSNARKGSRLSISPFGLSAQGYNGHIFGDTEFWMYPPMLFMNQGIARTMMDYRTDRLEAACQRALSYGYDGAMFPWESDDAGEESCPTWALTGAFEHHITADIAIAAWNYYCMNGDKRWLREEGFPLMEKAAEFWVSRVEKNKDGSYSIRNVVCADEYAEGVDDNAFTNGAAMRTLQDAAKAAAICGVKVPAIWKEIASKLRIPKFEDGVTMEYEGYNGQIIKQADANLLVYPLNLITRPEEIRKDLEYYEDKIDKIGPAMSFSVLALQYARLGESEKAYDLFVQSYRPNQLPPFGVLSEGAGGTNPYFSTGAGGLLQTVINGFCGLEITDNGIKQLSSKLPKHWKKLMITGVGKDKKTYSRIQK